VPTKAITVLGVLVALLVGPAAAGADARPVLRSVTVDVLYNETAADVDADIDDAAALGANTIRLGVNWAALQPTERGGLTQWYLGALDNAVSRARARGIKVLLTPTFTPCWASSVPGAPRGCGATGITDAEWYPPAKASTYATFVASLVRRYAGGLAGVEVWNEPDLTWMSADPATDYARLLQATYPAVTAAAPGLPVIAGSLAGVDLAFLARMRAAGIAGAYDAISVHPYNDGRAPTTLIDPAYAASTFLQGLQSLRQAMLAARDTHPVWLTETGWNTSTQRGQLWLDGVSPADQAAYLSQALGMLGDPASGIDYPAMVNVYRLRDVGTDPADPQHNYGLEAQDHTPKPSYAAVQAAFRALAGVSPGTGRRMPPRRASGGVKRSGFGRDGVPGGPKKDRGTRDPATSAAG
jgi:hypothetical protein